MVGLSIHPVRAHSSRAHGRAPRRYKAGRSFWDALLWGSATETCAECGVEVAPRSAYRESSRQVYCSLEHARLDMV